MIKQRWNDGYFYDWESHADSAVDSELVFNAQGFRFPRNEMTGFAQNAIAPNDKYTFTDNLIRFRRFYAVSTTQRHPQLHRICAFYGENSLFVVEPTGLALLDFAGGRRLGRVPVAAIGSFDVSMRRGLLSGVYEDKRVFLYSLTQSKMLSNANTLFAVNNLIGRASVAELATPNLVVSGNANYISLYELETFAERRVATAAFVNNHSYDIDSGRLIASLEQSAAAHLVFDLRAPVSAVFALHARCSHADGCAAVALGGRFVAGANVSHANGIAELLIWDLRHSEVPVWGAQLGSEAYNLLYEANSGKLIFGQQQDFVGAIDIRRLCEGVQIELIVGAIGGCALSDSGRTLAVTLPQSASHSGIFLYDI